MITTTIALILAFISAPIDTIYPGISRYEKPEKKVKINSPTTIASDISVSYYTGMEWGSVRIVYDSLNHIFYSNTFGGDVYRVKVVNGVPQYKELFISTSEHAINRMQGLLFHDNALYMVGNEAFDNIKKGKGRVVKCAIGPSGSKTFSSVLETDLYASSTTLFDHAFSAICLNQMQDSLYIASGSRTDHGEVKDVNGLFPGLREEPLTTKIYRIPLNSTNLYFYNDETWLTNSGYVYCRGVRNEFDLALNASGELFGVENMGDRDDPEELNLLKEGRHYGFPWRMGGNITPQQFAGYDPSQDLLLPSNLSFPAIFHNDPSYPAPPTGVTFVEPILNIGPDANFVRDPATGIFSAQNTTTFTSHRSPLGFIIDKENDLGAPYTAGGFVLAYTTGGGPSGYLNGVDTGGDLCHIKFNNQATGGYTVNVTKIAQGFQAAVDAVKVGNSLYVLQETGEVFKVDFPQNLTPNLLITAETQTTCNLTVDFSPGILTDYSSILWNFGDGNSSSQSSVSHTYAQAGNYTITMTKTNANGTFSASQTITLNANISLTGIAADGTINGFENIQSSQVINQNVNQNLFSSKSISLETGLEAKTGSTFLSKIQEGCQ